MDKVKRNVPFLVTAIFLALISWQSDQYKKDLLILKDTDGTSWEIRTESDWNKRREQIPDSIQLVMGQLPEVDPERIGCIGHSLGGHNSLFLAIFNKRIKAVVTSCGSTSFYKYYGGDLTGWSHAGYMPLIASKYQKDPARMPFDFTEIPGAIAPRALFINAPLRDSNFDISGVYDCVNAAREVYYLFKAGDKLRMTNPSAPHDFPPEARNEAYSFLDNELDFLFK